MTNTKYEWILTSLVWRICIQCQRSSVCHYKETILIDLAIGLKCILYNIYSIGFEFLMKVPQMNSNGISKSPYTTRTLSLELQSWLKVDLGWPILAALDSIVQGSRVQNEWNSLGIVWRMQIAIHGRLQC